MTQAEPAQPVPRRRTSVLVGVGVLVVVLVVGGLAVFLLTRKPDTASEVVDAFLDAARDGDAEKAAGWWKDAGPSVEGGKPVRQLVREYVERWGPEYERALDGRDRTMKETDAFLPDTDVLIGKSVEVTVDGRRATYVVLGKGEDWGIAFGPEDWIGQLAGRPHPLFPDR